MFLVVLLCWTITKQLSQQFAQLAVVMEVKKPQRAVVVLWLWLTVCVKSRKIIEFWYLEESPLKYKPWKKKWKTYFRTTPLVRKTRLNKAISVFGQFICWKPPSNRQMDEVGSK